MQQRKKKKKYIPSRKKYAKTEFLKQMSSAARTHRASLASVVGKPLKPHMSGSSNLLCEQIEYRSIHANSSTIDLPKKGETA